MKTKYLLCSLAVVVSIGLVSLGSSAEDSKEASVRDEMEAMNRNLRMLNRQYASVGQKRTSLELVAAMQKHAEKARTLTPAKADKLTGDEKTRFVDAFHKHLDELLKEIANLKDAISDDKTDVAKEEIEKIQQLRDSSHKELGVEMHSEEGRPHRNPPPPSGQ